MASSNHLKLEHFIKHNAVVQKLYRYGMSIVFRVWGIFVRIDDKLVLMNGHGYRYNDSPRAIYEKMLEMGIAKDYKIVWALNDPSAYDIPGNATKIKMDTLQYFYTALKAKYWISCVNIERGLHFKKKNQVYLNTWHGASLNYVGNAVEGRNDFHFEHINYFCYNGEYEKGFIKRDFNVLDKALIPTGYPRNDALYEATETARLKLREKFEVPEDKKIILYAPTWRESVDGGESYKLAPPIDWDKWEKRLGDRYVVFLRTHPYTTELMNVQFNSFVRNYINYPQVNDLLVAADILISDYSCIQLDYSILGRPQICFGYDYDEYKKQRGFYFDMEQTMPNGVMREEDQVIDHLLHLDYQEDCRKSRQFRDEHMEYGGNAAAKCIKIVFGK
ncbi:MAG: CDP-glycerol glycerophosphotransferase family protein [Lachnospiraceae bacterium]|nr:CDP-glycerol glycerophosphotransferase family protein [Lachnospiraceae bacterium]